MACAAEHRFSVRMTLQQKSIPALHHQRHLSAYRQHHFGGHMGNRKPGQYRRIDLFLQLRDYGGQFEACRAAPACNS